MIARASPTAWAGGCVPRPLVSIYRSGMDVDWNRPRLDGLADDEYFWPPVPGCWTLSRRGESHAPVSFGTGEFTMDYAVPPPSPEPVTTIAWRLAHLIVVFASTNASYFGGPPAGYSTFRYAGTAGEALGQLDNAHGTYISGVRSLGPAGLAQPQGPDQSAEYAEAPMAKLILYINMEVIHHGAEICLLRDLYLRQGERDGRRP